jgi:alanyl-tRNA synthetase
MRTDELRKRFLNFFEKKGHKVYPSAPLVPGDDPTLLFTGAGMNQFKDMFLGRGKLPFRRAATCQKCLRTVDIEKVGKTAAHHTFFEMLGNFSFGDYFKKEAIIWAWEFLTQELEIPAERLYVSIYTDDQEAYDIWEKEVGIPHEKIYRFGEDENFWPASAPSKGPDGPCGPCSEIFYDFGKNTGCGSTSCKVGCSCGRFVEVWNLVFMQFDRQSSGELVALPQKNIDTGMGLERLAAVMQGVYSNFETDIFKPIIQRIQEITGIDPSKEGLLRYIRRIADHIRAIVFCISEGILPSNEGRGYVERKILRTALRDGFSLGCKESFLYLLVEPVVETMGEVYPQLRERRENIERIIKLEEEKFLKTLQQGTNILQSAIERLRSEGKSTLPGEEAFELYDTYGFPLEMTQEILAEEGFQLDRAGFEEALKSQRVQARQHTQLAPDIFEKGPFAQIKSSHGPTQFVGYRKLASPARILAIIKGDSLVESAEEGDEALILLDKTPFYAESGGQVGDQGLLRVKDLRIEIKDTTKKDEYFLHHARILKGRANLLQQINALVDRPRRMDIARNHTATHLLQSALRKVLGLHVEQAGSLVSPERLRFDFTHFAALSEEEIQKVEDIVNGMILQNLKVSIEICTIQQAKEKGALMFFGEKYTDPVRMVSIGRVSRELCGGTHLKSTTPILCFKILSESSIGSGIRRIEALTGRHALRFFSLRYEIVRELSRIFNTPVEDVIKKSLNIIEEIKLLKRRLADMKKEKPLFEILPDEQVSIGPEEFILKRVSFESPAEMRNLADLLIKQKSVAGVFLLTRIHQRLSLVIRLADRLVEKGLDAGRIAKRLGELCGGGGGGKKYIAEAGGKDLSKEDKLFEEFKNIVKSAVER